MLSLRQQWKLADFNLACEFNPNLPMTDTVGTQPYAAPEVYQKSYTVTQMGRPGVERRKNKS